MRNLVSIVLSGTPKDKLHMGIKCPKVLAPESLVFLEGLGEFEESKNDLWKHRAIMVSDYVQEVVKWKIIP